MLFLSHYLADCGRLFLIELNATISLLHVLYFVLDEKHSGYLVLSPETLRFSYSVHSLCKNLPIYLTRRVFPLKVLRIQGRLTYTEKQCDAAGLRLPQPSISLSQVLHVNSPFLSLIWKKISDHLFCSSCRMRWSPEPR